MSVLTIEMVLYVTLKPRKYFVRPCDTTKIMPMAFSVVLGMSQRGLCLNSSRRANRTTFMRNKQLWSTVLLVLDMIKIGS